MVTNEEIPLHEIERTLTELRTEQVTSRSFLKLSAVRQLSNDNLRMSQAISRLRQAQKLANKALEIADTEKAIQEQQQEAQSTFLWKMIGAMCAIVGSATESILVIESLRQESEPSFIVFPTCGVGESVLGVLLGKRGCFIASFGFYRPKTGGNRVFFAGFRE